MTLDEALGWSDRRAAVRTPADPIEPCAVIDPPCTCCPTVALTATREPTDVAWAYTFENWEPVSADLGALAMSGTRR